MSSVASLPTIVRHHPEALPGPVATHTAHTGDFRWDGRPVLNYKEEGTHFKAICRQVLFPADPKLAAELRYFEIQPGGHSTLEKHDHIHSVMIIRGRGQVLVGQEIYTTETYDLIHIPSFTWHQFRAVFDDYFGFLCLVNPDRDRPQRPTDKEAAILSALPGVGDFARF
jgi:quercetin dioxygenase-like cupin family protein